MCLEQQLPRADRIARIIEASELAVNTGQEEFIIEDPSFRNLSSDEVLDFWNGLMTEQNFADFLPTDLIDQDRAIMEVGMPQEYEDIFEVCFPRRSDRPLVDPFSGDKYVMGDWIDIIKRDWHPNSERRYPLEAFVIGHAIRDGHLPLSLDIDSYVAGMLIDDLAPGLGLKSTDFKQWQPWMGTLASQLKTHPPPGFESQAGMQFVGASGPGRLVYAPSDWSHFDNETPNYRIFVQKYLAKEMKRIERTLIHLSRRIATFVLQYIMEEYVMEQESQLLYLDRYKLDAAVREILGEQWFDVEFDVDGKLASWSVDDVLKPDEEMTFDEIYLHD